MVSAVFSTHEGRYAILEADLPSGSAAIGVLLEDPSSDELHVRLRRDWEAVAGEDVDVFEALEDDLKAKASEMGAAKLFAYLEDALSDTLRITDRESVLVGNFDQTLN